MTVHLWLSPPVVVTVYFRHEWASALMAPSRPAGPGARILVVEDYDALRVLVTRVLAAEGHRVEAVATAASAWERLVDEPFDLLLTDHDVPGGDGTHIARQAVARQPGLRVLLVSGRPRDELDLEVPGAAAVRFLQKPFGIDELARCVGEVLSEPAS